MVPGARGPSEGTLIEREEEEKEEEEKEAIESVESDIACSLWEHKAILFSFCSFLLLMTNQTHRPSPSFFFCSYRGLLILFAARDH